MQQLDFLGREILFLFWMVVFVVFVVFYRRQLLCNTFGGFQEFIQELHESAAVN
jgi:hypothetical protein